MITLHLLNEEIFCCTKDEAGTIWRTRREDRPRIWLESECQAALLLDTAEICRIVDQKKRQPGYTYKGEGRG